MLFVKDDDLKQAFVTMMNKLVYAHRIILKPYVDALKNTSSDDSLRRIQEIQTLLAQNTEKRETLTKLMTQGIIDPILFNKETNELLSQADSFRDEKMCIRDRCQPDRAFKLTCEMLRRKPDSALIWYEDFRDYGVLQTNYWTTLSGSWTVWREDEYSESRVYSQLDGSGKLAWRYDGFSDIHLRARLADVYKRQPLWLCHIRRDL